MIFIAVWYHTEPFSVSLCVY